MSRPLLEHIEGLRSFHRSRNKGDAHFRSRDALKEMAADPWVLTAVFEVIDAFAPLLEHGSL